MNIEDMIMNGASEEEIQNALNQIKAEKARQEAALKAQAQAQKTNDKEALKAEARAYLINAIICYSQAFDLLGAEDGEWDQEDVDMLEAKIKQIEAMIPLYAKLIELQEDMDKDFGLGLAGGLF